MDAQQFDRLTQQFGRALTRRRFGAVLTALGLGAGLGAADEAAAKKKKKKKKKPKPCANGAVKCGNACANTQTDALNCGRCGVRCGNGNACVDGTCRGGCPPDQIRCVDLCVDPNDNEQHCGGCNRPCAGELTCLNGQCGCAAGTKCGNRCVDTQTDPDHCGGCNTPCGDQECVGGQCNPSGCRSDQIDCGNGRCIPDHEHACCSQVDCGGFSSTDLECRNDRCVCTRSGEGICLRGSTGRGICDVCCPGGSGQCPSTRPEWVCRAGATHPTCGCPPGYEVCQSNDYGYCSRDFDSDVHRCGHLCVDCQQQSPGSKCCDGRCVRGAAPDTCPQTSVICPDICARCPDGMICCNSGPGTTGGCVAGVATPFGPCCPSAPAS